MEHSKEYYIERKKKLERIKRLLKTNFFDDKIAECEQKITQLNKIKKE